MPVSEVVELKGHILDAGTLSRILDDALDLGTDYSIERFDVGRRPEDESYARIVVTAATEGQLTRLLTRLQVHGANLVDPGEALLRVVEKDGVFPEDFYSTTNLDTEVRVDGHWIEVTRPEMDCGLVVTGEGSDMSITTIPVSDIKAGDRVVCGSRGVKVLVSSKQHSDESVFEFMNSVVSSEKPQYLQVRQIAAQMREVKAAGKKVLWVGGPAVVHTGAAPAFCALIEAGFVDVLFAGNALATHDIESSLFGTSLGVDLSKGSGVDHGHEHHIRAINRIRGAGSIAAAVEQGVLTSGVMHDLVVHKKPYVLVGSVRPRRRAAAGRLHRRHRGPAGDARRAARRRFRDHGRDDAARDRHGQHPSRPRYPSCASTSTRPRSPSFPIVAARRRPAWSRTSGCSSSSWPRSSPATGRCESPHFLIGESGWLSGRRKRRGRRTPPVRSVRNVIRVSAHVSAASLVAAGLLDAARFDDFAPRVRPIRPRRTLRQRLTRNR